VKKLLIIFALLLCRHLSAQNITGVWRGYFLVSESGGSANKSAATQYNYEVQILEKSGGQLSGVTYTYKTKEYFGKANFTGNISGSRKSIVISESAIVAVEKKEKTDVCIMVCNLQYKQSNSGEETMSGTFTSRNPANNSSCFVGEVFLKRVPKPLFPAEAFLKKNSEVPSIKRTAQPVLDTSKPSVSVGAVRKKYLLELPDQQPAQQPASIPPSPFKSPLELLERDNKLLATILQAEKEVTVYIYDNGIVDNDSISVFVDSRKIFNGVRLSEKALSFPLSFSETVSQHEIVTYANNLGDISPNTGLLVIKAGTKMIEIPIMADFKKNAKIIISYKANCKVAVERYN
jgi:hypothetical protein